MSLRTDRVRIAAGILRKEGVSKEEFDRFWLQEHPKLFGELDIVKKHILKYEQATANVDATKGMAESGLTMAGYDAMSFFEAPTFGDLMKVFTSEEYRDRVGREAAKYIERGGPMFAANFVTFIDK